METPSVEKIICCGDRDRNDVWPAIAAMKDNNEFGPMMAMMNGGINNLWNNPFIYLVWMMFAQRMWNNGCNGEGNGCYNGQMSSIQNQMNDNQNANLIMDGIKGNTASIQTLASNLNCDFNTLNAAICDVRGGIDRLSGQVGFSSERVINAVTLGNTNLTSALQNCCCQTQKSILEQGYQNQLSNCNQTNTIMNGINTVNTGLERGFSSVAYETQRQTCDIINAGNANTQRLLDTLNSHWSNEISLQNQDLKFKISQLELNATLKDAIWRAARAESSGLFNTCGCSNSCGC